MRRPNVIALAALGLCVGAATAATTESGDGSATIGAGDSFDLSDRDVKVEQKH
jgi:hypothetical protein